MGFFGRLFGKKEDEDPGFAGMEHTSAEQPIPQDDLGLEEHPAMPDMPQQPDMPPQDLGSPQEHPLAPNIPKPQISSRDVELLNSKLDTLKAILNSMDQRIANLEKAAGVEQKKMPWH